MATHSSILAWKVPGTEEPSSGPRVTKSSTWLKQLSTHIGHLSQKGKGMTYEYMHTPPQKCTWSPACQQTGSFTLRCGCSRKWRCLFSQSREAWAPQVTCVFHILKGDWCHLLLIYEVSGLRIKEAEKSCDAQMIFPPPMDQNFNHTINILILHVDDAGDLKFTGHVKFHLLFSMPKWTGSGTNYCLFIGIYVCQQCFINKTAGN